MAPGVSDTGIVGVPEPSDIGQVAPSAEVRARLVEFLETDDSRLGQVYRGQQRDLSPEAIAADLGVSTSRFTWNQARIARALLEGDLPTAPTVAQAVAQKFRSMLSSEQFDGPVQTYLETNLRVLEQHAPKDEIAVERLSRVRELRVREPELVEKAVSVEVGASFDAKALSEIAAGAPYRLEISPHVYLSITAAIQSGKHVILTGPPGTAKTTLAMLTSELASQAGWCSGYQLTTATADWTTYETIGGLRPS